MENVESIGLPTSLGLIIAKELKDKYGIDIQFCNKADTGYVLTQILGG